MTRDLLMHNNKKHGFTLVELIVVLALLAVVIILGYQLISFGQNTFTRGENQYATQENVRFSTDLITRELRNAKEVTLLPGIPASFETNKRYIFISDGKLKQYLGSGTTIDALGSVNEDVEFVSLSFSTTSPSSILSFSVRTKSGTSEFEADSEVKVLNLPNGKAIDNTQLTAAGLSSGPVICYSFANNEKSLNYFALKTVHNPMLTQTTEVNVESYSFTCFVLMGTDKTKLIPYFEYTGKSVKVNGVTQIPGVTQNNFTNPLVYTVTAEDGSTVDYTVTVQEIVTRPEASGVKIIVINEGAPFENSTLHGDYSYIENGCGPQGASIYQWQSSTTEDFATPTNIATTRDIVPMGKAGLWVRFGVKPVSASGIPSDRFYYSTPKLIFPAIDDNPFWKSFINDLYVSALPASEQPEGFVSSVLYRTKYKAMSNLSPNAKDLNLTMSYDYSASGISDGGSHIYKDFSKFVKDVDSFSITVDAQVKSGSGYGILLYGAIKDVNSTDKNVDTGYMFQFDPGWNGFLIRKIENGQHNPWYRAFGLIKNVTSYQIGDYESFYYDYMKYTPQNIRNKFFRWSTDDTYQDISQWQQRYKTEITLQRQLDKSIIFKVTIKDVNDNVSNEMWFGDFTPFTMPVYDKSGNYIGNNTTVKENKLTSFSTQGTYLGLRTWDKGTSAYKTVFQTIKLGDGFSMTIQNAEFLSPTQVKIKLDQDLKPNFDLSKIQIKNLSIARADLKTTADEGQVVILSLNSPASISQLTSGMSKGLTLNRGGVKQAMAGDVKVVNGTDFDIGRDRTSPEVFSVTRIDNQTLMLTFSEEINESTTKDLTKFTAWRSNNSTTKYNPQSVSVDASKKKVTLTFQKNINNFDKFNRITISDVEDLAGNKMVEVTDKAYPF